MGHRGRGRRAGCQSGTAAESARRIAVLEEPWLVAGVVVRHRAESARQPRHADHERLDRRSHRRAESGGIGVHQLGTAVRSVLDVYPRELGRRRAPVEPGAGGRRDADRCRAADQHVDRGHHRGAHRRSDEPAQRRGRGVRRPERPDRPGELSGGEGAPRQARPGPGSGVDDDAAHRGDHPRRRDHDDSNAGRGGPGASRPARPQPQRRGGPASAPVQRGPGGGRVRLRGRRASWRATTRSRRTSAPRGKRPSSTPSPCRSWRCRHRWRPRSAPTNAGTWHLRER